MDAVVRSLEALVAEAGRLRAAVADAESTLGRLEAELDLRRADTRAAEETAQRLRVGVQESEAELHRLADERQRWTPASRRASPPARTVPPLRGGGSVEQSQGLAWRTYERLVRLHADLAASVGERRQQLRAAEGAVRAGRDSVSAKSEETEQQRSALAVLRQKLSDAPAEEALAAQIAAALDDASGVAKASEFARADIPADYLDLYRRAAVTCPGLSWTVLAAIGSVETAHGRSTLPGVHDGTNAAGAMGPMQFIAETWAAYAVDGDGDSARDVYRPADAVFGAARYLCASGAGDRSRLAAALWAYNHADWYVASVLARAAAYGMPGLGAAEVDGRALVDHPGLTLSDEARADLLSGAADPRVVAVLAAAVAEHPLTVSVIKSGHSQFVRGTDRVSNHFHGRAVDISSVDGTPVSSANSAALRLAVALLTADRSLRPDELGSPWPELSRFPGAFSDSDHTGHLHLGWRADPAHSPTPSKGLPR